MKTDVKIVKYDLGGEMRKNCYLYYFHYYCDNATTINEKGGKSNMLYSFIISASACMTLTQIPKEQRNEIKENTNKEFLK